MYDIVIGRSKEDRDKYGTKGSIFLGRQYVTMGQTTSLSNNVYLDMIRSHVVLIVGKRGSGKCLHGDTLITLDDGSIKKIKDLENDIKKVYTLDLKFNIKKVKKTHFYKRSTHKLLEVILHSGKAIKLTPEHPLLTANGWLAAEQLHPGSLVATPKKIEVFGDLAIKEQEIKLLAYFTSEVQLQKGFVLFSNQDQKIIEDFKTAILNFDGKLHIEEVYKNGSVSVFIDQQSFSNSPIQIWIEKFNFNKKQSLDKFIPKSIFTAKKKHIVLFLNRLFSCNGNIYKKANHWFLNYCSPSNKLLSQIQHLLLRFGIISTIKNNILEICGENVHTYLQVIGFLGEKEESAQNALKNSMDITCETRFATSDIFWDEVVSLKHIEGEFDVYDLTIPETHNFVANDIVVHNSYTMGAIAEGMVEMPTDIKQNLSIILLDTMGVYWTMKYPNRKELLMLRDWGLEPKGLDVQIYTPTAFHKEYKEKGIPTDFSFALQPNELSALDWCTTFDVDINAPIGVFIERIINKLNDTAVAYSIEDIISAIDTDKGVSDPVRDATKNRFVNTLHWGLFDKQGTSINELVQAGKVTVLDVSCYATTPNGWKIKCLVVGLLSQKLFMHRMLVRKNEEFAQIHETMRYFGDSMEEKKDFPLVWVVVDEAHEFLPKEGKTTASNPLITILREGRQPGISLILATQQPGKIHTDVMTQSDTVVGHRITAKIDTDALGTLMQSYMREGLTSMLDHLPRTKGSAIVFDDTNERLFPIKIRPRSTWHGGESPTAIREERKKFSF